MVSASLQQISSSLYRGDELVPPASSASTASLCSSKSRPVIGHLIAAAKSANRVAELQEILLSDALYPIFPELSHHRTLALDGLWHREKTCLAASLRAVELCSEYISAKGESFASPWVTELALVSACFLNLGKRPWSEDTSDTRGMQETLLPRLGVVKDGPRIRFSGHASRGADILRSRLVDLAVLEDSVFPLERFQIALAANWLRCSHSLYNDARQCRPEIFNEKWAESRIRDLFKAVPIAPNHVGHEALSGLMTLLATRHLLCQPEILAESNFPAPQAQQARWNRQGDMVNFIERTLRSSIDRVVQNLACSLNVSVVGGMDWNCLQIPIQKRREAMAVIRSGIDNGESRATVLKNLAPFSAQSLSDADITRLAAEPPYPLPPYGRFFNTLPQTSIDFTSDRYRVAFSQHAPIRQFTTMSDVSDIKSKLEAYPFPQVQLWLDSIREQGSDQGLSILKQLLTTGPFSSIPELEHFLHTHVVDPRLVTSKTFSLQRFAEVTRTETLQPPPVPIVILHGFQGSELHSGSGIEHILHARWKDIVRLAKRANMIPEAMAKSFIMDGLLYVAGTATLRSPSCQKPLDHSILTGPARDKRYLLSLILRRGRDSKGHEVDFLVTAIFHDSQEQANSYTNNNDVGANSQTTSGREQERN